MHRVDPDGPLWRSSVWGDAGQIVRLHGTEEFALRWARTIDRIMNPDRGVARPSVPATAAMLRTRVAMLAQTCLTRSQAVEPRKPEPERPEPAKDLGDPRLGQPGVDLYLNGDGEPAQRVYSPGSFYSPLVQRYWASLFEICFDLLQRIDQRPSVRPIPGRVALVPCRYGCGRSIEESALLVAILAESGLELSLGCGCFVPDTGPPSEDSEPPPPMLPPPEPPDPRDVLMRARAIAADRDAGTQQRAISMARPLLAHLVRPSSEPDELPPPSDDDVARDPDETEHERSEPELDLEAPREHSDPPATNDDDWIF